MHVLSMLQSELRLPSLVTSHSRCDHDLQVKHYPPYPTGASGRDRLSTHVDLSSITLLCQDALGGLELELEGEFVPVPVQRDAVLCNAGVFLEEWSDGAIRALPHRVRGQGTNPRTSIVFFCWPNHDALIGGPEGTTHCGDRMPFVM